MKHLAWLERLCAEDYKQTPAPKRTVDSKNVMTEQEYLFGPRKQRTSPAAITQTACHLFAVSRNERRGILARVTDSERRLLLKEADRIKKRMVDSNLGYDPELCWAIQRASDLNDPDAERILDSRQTAGTLPYEVEKWYAKYQTNPFSLATQDAERDMKPYCIIEQNHRRRITDDALELDKYLAPAEEQEEQLERAVDEAVEGGKNLSEGAEAKLNDFKEGARKEATSFVERIVNQLSEIMPDVAAQDAADDGAEAAEQVVEQETCDGADDKKDDTEFAEETAAFEMGDSAEEPENFCDDGGEEEAVKDDSKPYHQILRERMKQQEKEDEGKTYDPPTPAHDSQGHEIHVGDRVLTGKKNVRFPNEKGTVESIHNAGPNAWVDVRYDRHKKYGYKATPFYEESKNVTVIQDSEEVTDAAAKRRKTREMLIKRGIIKDKVKVEDGSEKLYVGNVVKNNNPDSTFYGRTGKVYETRLVNGQDYVVVVYEDDTFDGYYASAYEKVSDGCPIKDDAASPKIQIIKEPGVTTIYPEDNVEINIDNAKISAVVVDIDPVLRTVTIQPNAGCMGESKPEVNVKEMTVSEDMIEDYPMEAVPENPITPTEEVVMDAVKGVPTKLLNMFQEGQVLKMVYKVKDVRYNQGMLALGKGRLQVTLDGDIPKSMFDRFKADITNICRQQGYDVEVKFPKLSMTGADHFEIIFKGNGVGDSAVNPMEVCIAGDVVSFNMKQYHVDRANNKQVTLSDPMTGHLTVVEGPQLNDLYIVSKVNRKDPKSPANKNRIKDDALSDVRDVFAKWIVDNSAELATNADAAVHDEAFRALTDSLKEVDPKFELSDGTRAVMYSKAQFASDDASSLNVGGTMFLYQASQQGVDSMSAQVADAAGSLYESLASVEDSDDEEVYLDEKDVEEVFDSVGVRVNDAADASLLSDEAKQEVLNKVQEKIKERLQEAGLEVEDSAMNWADQGTAALRMKMGLPVKDADGKECKITGLGRTGYKTTDADGNVCKRDYPVKDSEPTLEELNKQIADAEAETDVNPTEEQKKSGDYKKGRVNIQGLDIAIENPKGSVRSGVADDGTAWETQMQNTYGEIVGTEGNDHDALDVFLGPNPLAPDVFVVDQLKNDGSFDEHKIMLGFDNSEDARAAYLSNYDDGWESHIGSITKCCMDDFKNWAMIQEVREFPFTDFLTVSTEPVVKDAMDKNEDRDEGIMINWNLNQLDEYYKRADKRAAELKAKGFFEDSALPAPKAETHDGNKNHYDVTHTRETFQQMWDSNAELDKVLGAASKSLGRPDTLTREDYRNLLTKPDDYHREIAAVADSAFALDALGLFTNDLYKQRFSDTFWVADSAESLEEPFNLKMPDEFKGKPVIVSTRPFNEKNRPVVDSMTEFPYDKCHNLYIATLSQE